MKTVGGDKAYDTRDFVADCRACNVTPHVARQVRHRGSSAIGCGTTRHGVYGICQVIRKRIEEHFD